MIHYLEVNPYRALYLVIEAAVSEAKHYTALAYSSITYQQNFEEVIIRRRPSHGLFYSAISELDSADMSVRLAPQSPQTL
jgi:predicted NAD/FAD-binding protein